MYTERGGNGGREGEEKEGMGEGEEGEGEAAGHRGACQGVESY